MGLQSNQKNNIIVRTPSKSAGASPFRKQLPRVVKRTLWQGKVGPAFWTVASFLSMSVSIGLIVMLIFLARQLFALKQLVSPQLLDGLSQNFVLTD